MLPAEYPRHRPVPSTLCPCHAWWGRFWRPFFRRGEAAIHETLIPADLPAIVELVEERPPQRQQHATLLPLSAPAPPSTAPTGCPRSSGGGRRVAGRPEVGAFREADAVESAPTARR